MHTVYPGQAATRRTYFWGYTVMYKIIHALQLERMTSESRILQDSTAAVVFSLFQIYRSSQQDPNRPQAQIIKDGSPAI